MSVYSQKKISLTWKILLSIQPKIFYSFNADTFIINTFHFDEVDGYLYRGLRSAGVELVNLVQDIQKKFVTPLYTGEI